MAARTGVDKWMFFITLVLVVVGLAMVFSASAVVAQARYNSEFADVGRLAGWAQEVYRLSQHRAERLIPG